MQTYIYTKGIAYFILTTDHPKMIQIWWSYKHVAEDWMYVL